MIGTRVKAKRGAIRDRHGKGLAITVDVDSVYAEPRRIDDPRLRKAREASRDSPSAKVAEKIGRRRSFVYIQRRVDANAAANSGARAAWRRHASGTENALQQYKSRRPRGGFTVSMGRRGRGRARIR